MTIKPKMETPIRKGRGLPLPFFPWDPGRGGAGAADAVEWSSSTPAASAGPEYLEGSTGELFKGKGCKKSFFLTEALLDFFLFFLEPPPLWKQPPYAPWLTELVED